MSVMIGIDPHKAVHAACAIDRQETELAEVVVRSGPRQLDQLLDWAAGFEHRTWAIECLRARTSALSAAARAGRGGG